MADHTGGSPFLVLPSTGHRVTRSSSFSSASGAVADEAATRHRAPGGNVKPAAAEAEADADAGAAFVLESKGTWWHAGFHLTTAMVGPAVLSLPYAFRGIGWGLGLGVLTALGAISFYTYYIMSRVLDHCEAAGRRHIRFRDLAADIFGSGWAFYLVVAVQTAINTGTTIGSILLAANCVEILYSSLTTDGPLKLYHFILLIAVVLAVLSQMPSFHSLRYINLGSLLLSLGYTILLSAACIRAGMLGRDVSGVGAAPSMPLQPPSRQPGPPAYMPFQPQFSPQFPQFPPPLQFQQSPRPNLVQTPPGQLYTPAFGQFQAQPQGQQSASINTSVARNKRKKKKGGTQGGLGQQPPPFQPPFQPAFTPQQPQAPMPFVPVQQPEVQVASSTMMNQTTPMAESQANDVMQEVGIKPNEQAKNKKPRCWKCAVDSHATKDCTALHYCLICDNSAHPSVRCPVLKLPRPKAFVAGIGMDSTFFLQLPDSVYKPHLAPVNTPTALVKFSGDPVLANTIEKQMARFCPASPQWKWEAIPHGTDAFLIGFPSFEDLERVEDLQMKVPSSNTQITVSRWTVQDIPHKSELKKVWVHVNGVPYTVRHFLGLWAVGSLLGSTLDVDLVTLRRRGIVRIHIAMIDTKCFDKACGAAVVVKFKAYEFWFRREAEDFVPDPDFVPFFWRAGDDNDDDDMGKDRDADAAPNQSGGIDSQHSNMEVDQTLPKSSSSHHQSAPNLSRGMNRTVRALTPLNPHPTTPYGIELVRKARAETPWLFADFQNFSSTTSVFNSSDADTYASGSHSNAADVCLSSSVKSSGCQSAAARDATFESAPEHVAREVDKRVPAASDQPVQPALAPVGLGAASPGPAGDSGGLGCSSPRPTATSPNQRVPGPGLHPAPTPDGLGLASPAAAAALPPTAPGSVASQAAAGVGTGRAATTPSPVPVSAPLANRGVASSPTMPLNPMTPPRRSGRHASSVDGAAATDEDSLVKAMRRKAEKNLDSSGLSSNAPAKDYSLSASKTEKTFDAFLSVSILAAAYGNGILPEIQATLAPPAAGKMAKALVICYSVACFTFYLPAITGYWAFGKTVRSNAMQSLMPETGPSLAPTWLLGLAVVLVLLQLLAIALLYAQVAYEVMEKMLADPVQGRFSRRNLVPRLALRTMYVAFCAFVAAALPFFGAIVGVIGSVGFIPLDFVIPVVMYNMAVSPPRRSMVYMINLVIMVVFTGVGVIGAVASVRKLVINARRFKLFSGHAFN